jgi:D-beta-D-heptose 7-phosphate kinase/D-beta-D-heptose 1-phosphate adenosyltransferase
MNFLIIGEKCKDVFVYGEVTRLSPEAPVPVFNPTRKVENLGMAANVYNNLFNLIEKKASLIGHFSNDNIIKTRYVDDKSNHYFLRIDENDKTESIRISPNLTKVIHSSDCIIISDYDKGFISLNDIWSICQEAKESAVIFLDTKKKLTPVIFDQVDFVKFNESEYNLNIKNSEEFSNKIIVTKGGNGAYYDGEDFPSEKKLTIDVSGAGDTFLAALAFYFMTSRDIKIAIQEANKAACKVVSERGVSVI